MMILIDLIVLVVLTRGCNAFPQQSIPLIGKSLKYNENISHDMMNYKYLTDKDLGDLKYFLMDDDYAEVITATLKWSNDWNVTIKLENAGVKCMYQGSYPEETSSVILVTGCNNEIQDILIQSSKYGDILGTVSNGIVELLHATDSIENDSPNS